MFEIVQELEDAPTLAARAEAHLLNQVGATWTAREFMAKFTNVELIAIAEAKRTNAQLEIWWTTATAGNVEQDHPDTSAGLTYLQSLGLIDASRIPEIMD
tara:strand:- start:537 stop:836 length:300 start_codon:yes stop_codon:yes gene_type:complete